VDSSNWELKNSKFKLARDERFYKKE
jgi:hypothetical protein